METPVNTGINDPIGSPRIDDRLGGHTNPWILKTDPDHVFQWEDPIVTHPLKNPILRLSIHGSRTLRDERVRIIILEEIQKHRPDVIVTHAEPEGVCAIARAIALDQAIPLMLHALNFRYLRGAFEHRSKAVLNNSDACLFIHNGHSKGTANEIRLAQKMGLPCFVHTIEITRFKASVGFDIDRPWEIESLKMEEPEGLIDVDALMIAGTPATKEQDKEGII